MKYISVCSGIEAATVAWHPLGFEPLAFSEIEPFPCKVLAHHYPDVPNWGDMTKFKEWPNANIDVLVGGTPCQSFSIAGLRKGLDDPRGNLMLTYLAIAAKYRPTKLVWENVPGVLSSNNGRDFGTFLAGLGQLGYGFAYRVLDAQFVRTDGHPYAVPQRRRRVFVVGCLGDWRRAAAVLFDSESLRGNPPPRREAGKEVTGPIMARTTGGGGFGGEFETSGGLQAVARMVAFGEYVDDGVASAMKMRDYKDATDLVYPINTQIATRHEAMGEGTGMGIGADGDAAYTLQAAHGHAVAFGVNEKPDVGHCLRSGASKADKHESTTYITAFAQNTRDEVREMAVPGALAAQPGMKQTSYLRQGMQVRRLTPLECERLQGFPDNYTNIPSASDSARYKALGNSMACNVMQLIGERIKAVDNLPASIPVDNSETSEMSVKKG